MSKANQHVEIRDRRGGFLWINNEIIDNYATKIGGSALLVYMILCRYANNASGESMPGQDRIAQFCDMTERSVRRAISVLKQAGLIAVDQYKVKGKFDHNVYILLAVQRSSPEDKFVLRPEDAPEDTVGHLPQDTVGQTVGHQRPTNNTEQERTIQNPVPPSEEPRLSLHKESEQVIKDAYRFMNKTEAPWDGSEAKNLKNLLGSCPSLTVDEIRNCLWNFWKSEVNHSVRPREFIPKLLNYRAGPLDRFGQPKNAAKAAESPPATKTIRERLLEQTGPKVDRQKEKPG